MTKASDREYDGPFMKFFVDDYLGDDNVQLCSLAAQGLWCNMLFRMHKAPKRGYLCLKKQPMTKEMAIKALAKWTANPEQTISELLTELDDHGVYSTDADGCIYNRRMLKEVELSEKRARAGRKGGSTPKGKQETSKPGTTGKANTGNPESRVQSPGVACAQKGARSNPPPEAENRGEPSPPSASPTEPGGTAPKQTQRQGSEEVQPLPEPEPVDEWQKGLFDKADTVAKNIGGNPFKIQRQLREAGEKALAEKRDPAEAVTQVFQDMMARKVAVPHVQPEAEEVEDDPPF